MNFSIDKILAAFGNPRALERTHKDNYTEDIINSIEEKPFAVSKQNVMYAGLKELAGYYYFKTIIVGSFKVKTFKGAALKIELEDEVLDLKSDMLELESDFSNVSNRYISSIDFEIEKDEVTRLSKSNVKSLQLLSKKQDVRFTLFNATQID